MYGYIYSHTFLIIFLFFMALPNIYFEEYPIDFKAVNPHDLVFYQVGRVEKIIISPDERGYIESSLNGKIELQRKNTIVVNAAVGQGKSYAIIKLIKRFFDESEDYIIIVAAPFVSLVNQYWNNIIREGIPENKVYRYESIGDSAINYLDKRVHVLTVNCLLGNPGEDAFINAKAKRIYLTEFSEFCAREKKKVVFVYDEIHDAIHNFTELCIFNLWKWHGSILKNIILSATFNNASKVVIEYLAELTNREVVIFESERIPNVSSLSNLYLHFDSSNYFKEPNKIKDLIEELVSENKLIDILSYSKKLAEKIHDPKGLIGDILKKKYGQVNLCISDNESTYTKTFDPSMCNVGTNFKTGISIEKDNHAFIIILPTLQTKTRFGNKYGIFSDGITSIIQAFARQRKKGDIHVILPPPDKFDIKSLTEFNDESGYNMTEDQINSFVNFYSYVENNNVKDDKLVEFISFNRQELKLFHFYHQELYPNHENEIKMVEKSNRDGLMKLVFPEYNFFKLRDGEKYLSRKFKFLGADLSSFVVYSAITNQFMNCKFVGFTIDRIIITDGIQNTLNEIVKIEDYGQHSFFDWYNNLNNYFFEKKETFIDKEHISKHKVLFCQEILSFLYQKMYDTLLNEEFKDENGKYLDGVFNQTTYLLLMMSYAHHITEDDHNSNIVNYYKQLSRYRQMIIDSIQEENGSIKYFLNHRDFNLSSRELETIRILIINLNSEDNILREKVIGFIPDVASKNDIQLKRSFYSALKKTITHPTNLDRYSPRINGEIKNYSKFIEPSMVYSLNENISRIY